jgi:hypothetical protein
VNPQLNIMADENAEENAEGTLLTRFNDGFILRNAGQYLSFFEVSQYLITCKDWRLVFKGTETPIKEFCKCFGRKVLGSLMIRNPHLGGGITWIGCNLDWIGCNSLQDIRIFKLFIRLLCDSEIMEGCLVNFCLKRMVPNQSRLRRRLILTTMPVIWT